MLSSRGTGTADGEKLDGDVYYIDVDQIHVDHILVHIRDSDAWTLFGGTVSPEIYWSDEACLSW